MGKESTWMISHMYMYFIYTIEHLNHWAIPSGTIIRVQNVLLVTNMWNIEGEGAFELFFLLQQIEEFIIKLQVNETGMWIGATFLLVIL